MRTRFIGAAAALALPLLATGCGQSSQQPHSLGGRMLTYETAANQAYQDVDLSALVPGFESENQKLLAKGQQLFDFCAGWALNLKATQPHPTDLDTNVTWANAAVSVVRSIDPTKPYHDTTDPRQAVETVKLPAEIQRDLARELVALNAYSQRLQQLQQSYRAGLLDKGTASSRLQRAHVQLIQSDYSSIDPALWAFFGGHCAAP